MENTNERTVANLKHLLSICNDGKEGYKTAAQNSDSDELKALFSTYSIQRAGFEMELKKCIHQCNADPDNEIGGPLGVLHRAWMEIKTMLTANDNKAILEACVTGEKAAVESYSKALEDPELQTEVREILLVQLNGVRDCLKNIESLQQRYAA
ncbi:ferritin-like domain-containing protein [Pararcticibacter amylolyticus]|uniref:DUF2383 domain-containing protein n=1 Tax=Pararcticibacter amylolyticus TaxID=2173175 RepID=A0A2U2PFI7_9SPHI|nr:PA2169 family four-helix-bundle protein [Pararcticibacter amylolyticus]PWG80094.1 hypothetical protein DDR33_12885 [Pararcticibacter amylolyticus]